MLLESVQPVQNLARKEGGKSKFTEKGGRERESSGGGERAVDEPLSEVDPPSRCCEVDHSSSGEYLAAALTRIRASEKIRNVASDRTSKRRDSPSC